MQRFSMVLFRLPDGRIILQRRTLDAPYAPGTLGIFGGGVEEDESPEQCIVREIAEETSLDTGLMKIDKVADFIISASDGYATDRQFFLYETELKTDGFEVYEGDGAEAYRLDELKGRTDLTDSAAHVFTMLGIL